MELALGLKVDVYKNLHKGLLSVRHKGKVIAHVEEISLIDVCFAVQPAGRAKVLAEQRKNVHACVRGYIAKEQMTGSKKITYNPYIAGYFRDEMESPIYESKTAKVTLRGIFI